MFGLVYDRRRTGNGTKADGEPDVGLPATASQSGVTSFVKRRKNRSRFGYSERRTGSITAVLSYNMIRFGNELHAHRNRVMRRKNELGAA